MDAFWSPAGKGLTSWLAFVMSYCEVVTFPQVWCLIVSIPDLCPISYFVCVFYDGKTRISEYGLIRCLSVYIRSFDESVTSPYTTEVLMCESKPLEQILIVSV